MGFELEAIERYLRRLDDRQRRMIALMRQGFTMMGVHMGEIDDRLADLADTEDAEHAQLARLLVDFEATLGQLNPAQEAAFDAIKAHILGDTAAIADADPEVTVEAGTGEDAVPGAGG